MSGRLLAIGDVHGCYCPLKTMLEEQLKLKKEDRLILLGDYIDGGTQSKEVLDYIMRLIEDGYQLIPLLGNHEDMLLKALIDYKYFVSWHYNGGYTTLESFSVSEPNKIGDGYFRFLRQLKYCHIDGRRIFVHAGFNDELANPFEDTTAMLWSRNVQYSNPMLSKRTIIHGHSIISLEACQRLVESNSSVINIDTGCFMGEYADTGFLTAIQLPERILFHVAYC